MKLSASPSVLPSCNRWSASSDMSSIAIKLLDVYKRQAATAEGTAVAPGVGTAIGLAAGYAAGVSIEAKDEKMTNRSRKIKFCLEKMKAQENQTDSVAKLVKDLIVRKAITWVKAAAPVVGLVPVSYTHLNAAKIKSSEDKLSSKAQKYLETLRKDNADFDFIIADKGFTFGQAFFLCIHHRNAWTSVAIKVERHTDNP